MKKTNRKLQLKANTLRVLQNSELSQVAGARITFTCTMQPTNCLVEVNQDGGDNTDR